MIAISLVTFIFIILAISVARIFFHHKMEAWEYVSLPIIAILATALVVSINFHQRKTDTEYWGELILKVEYVEYYETYVVKTCTRSYDCNCSTTNGRRSCSTCYETYDCSYCDYNPKKYYAYTKRNKYQISEGEYNKIKAKFGNETFVELNRSINRSFGCGVDGDSYVSVWGWKNDNAENATTEHSYENKVILSNVYSFPFDGNMNGIFDYPKVDGVYQKGILGKWKDANDLRVAEQKLQYFNGLNGEKIQMKVFVFIYENADMQTFERQRNFMKGGNKNEMIVCLSKGSDGQVKWAKAFSWTDEKICENEVTRFWRENPSATMTGFFDYIFPVWEKNWKRKHFKPLNDLVVMELDETGWKYFIITLLVVLGIACGIFFYTPKTVQYFRGRSRYF
jgi:hypothetical protein